MSEQYPFDNRDSSFEAELVASEASSLLKLIPEYLAKIEEVRSVTADTTIATDVNLATYNYEHELISAMRLRFVQKFSPTPIMYRGSFVDEIHMYIPMEYVHKNITRNNVDDVLGMPNPIQPPSIVLLKVLFDDNKEQRFAVTNTQFVAYTNFDDLQLTIESYDYMPETAVLCGATISPEEQVGDVLAIGHALSLMRLGNQSRNDDTVA